MAGFATQVVVVYGTEDYNAAQPPIPIRRSLINPRCGLI